MKKTTKQSKTARTSKTSKKIKIVQRKSIAGHAVHHTKRLFRATPMFVHGVIAGTFIGVVLVASLGIGQSANAATLSSSRDCSSNAVLNCGALNTTELRQKYSQSGASIIYNYYGIDVGDIANIERTAVVGLAKKDGTILVNGKVVAINASSTGRNRINGSHAVSSNGLTFYETTNQAAFRSDIPAYVSMKSDGTYDFAILGACGNPIRATNVLKPTPKPPTPAPTTPTPPPAPPKPIVLPPAPPAPPVVTEASVETPPPAPTELPNTGPAAIITIVALAAIGGYVFHISHHHIRHRRHAKKATHHHA